MIDRYSRLSIELLDRIIRWEFSIFDRISRSNWLFRFVISSCVSLRNIYLVTRSRDCYGQFLFVRNISLLMIFFFAFEAWDILCSLQNIYFHEIDISVLIISLLFFVYVCFSFDSKLVHVFCYFDCTFLKFFEIFRSALDD